LKEIKHDEEDKQIEVQLRYKKLEADVEVEVNSHLLPRHTDQQIKL
jgi:hypothetical protein